MFFFFKVHTINFQMFSKLPQYGLEQLFHLFFFLNLRKYLFYIKMYHIEHISDTDMDKYLLFSINKNIFIYYIYISYIYIYTYTCILYIYTFNRHNFSIFILVIFFKYITK